MAFQMEFVTKHVSLMTLVYLYSLLSWAIPLYKESLSSDGKQFYQNQQNEQSPLTSTERTQYIPRHMYCSLVIKPRTHSTVTTM